MMAESQYWLHAYCTVAELTRRQIEYNERVEQQAGHLNSSTFNTHSSIAYFRNFLQLSTQRGGGETAHTTQNHLNSTSGSEDIDNNSDSNIGSQASDSEDHRGDFHNEDSELMSAAPNGRNSQSGVVVENIDRMQTEYLTGDGHAQHLRHLQQQTQDGNGDSRHYNRGRNLQNNAGNRLATCWSLMQSLNMQPAPELVGHWRGFNVHSVPAVEAHIHQLVDSTMHHTNRRQSTPWGQPGVVGYAMLDPRTTSANPRNVSLQSALASILHNVWGGASRTTQNRQGSNGNTSDSNRNVPNSSPYGSGQDNLVHLFSVLLSNFYFEVFLWIYLNVLLHPRSRSTRNRLKYLGHISNQSVEQVTMNVLLGYLNGFQQGREALMSEIRTVLNEVSTQGDRSLNPERLAWLRELSIELGIHLNARQMLRSFSAVVRDVIMRRVPNVPQPRCPPTSRRRTRERHVGRHESPERRAFQPPHLPPRHHPAVLPHQSQQQPVIIDMEQVRVPVSNPASLPYGVPVCTTPHYMPMCTGAHVNMCTTQSTWSLPGCNMGIPSCSIQHIPACGLQQFPVTPHGLPPTMLHSHTTQHHPHPHPHAHPHPHHHTHPHPHQAHHPSHHAQHHPLTQATQFVPGATQVQHEEEVQIIAEHRPPLHPVPPTLPHGPSMNPSPPVLLQEPSVHPTPHDIYSPFSRYRRTTTNRSRWRSIPPPPPPYPGFLLHFLAMLGNPPVHPYGMDINDEATEVENYEALLNLAERLGEAKPKGLLKAEIDQLPSYRFNSDINRSSMEQTNCVVCMCEFESRQLLRVLPCSHEFHAKCVDKWLKTNRTCPICRADASDSVSQSE